MKKVIVVLGVVSVLVPSLAFAFVRPDRPDRPAGPQRPTAPSHNIARPDRPERPAL